MNATRFRPHRLGIVGLYEYADQEFAVEDGRLALRGRNTSGKSKALELLIPYVLDGDITPRKLDPFASSAKTMRWNLIECTDAHDRVNKRIGYVWAEFRAVDEDGGERFFTCGLGLEATRNADGIKDRWYFTTPLRIGADVELTRVVGDEDTQPVVKSDLIEQLGGDETFYGGPSEYKEALRAQLLPFASAELYEQMLEVIRQLRKPKLSDSLNVKGLSAMLSGALPAVDDTLVRKLGDALEQLHELQRQHDELRDARAEVSALVNGEGRSYARGVLAIRSERLKAAVGVYERARAAARARDDEYEAAEVALAAADSTAAGVADDQRRVSEEHLALVSSEAYKAVGLLEARTREHEQARQRAERAHATARRYAEQVEHAHTAVEQTLAAAAAAQAALIAAGERLAAQLRCAGLDCPPLQAGVALDALAGRLAVRASDVERADELLAGLATAEGFLHAIADPLALAADRRDASAEAMAAAQALLEAAIEQYDESLHTWRLALRELPVDDAQLELLATAAGEDGDPHSLLTDFAAARGEELATREAQLTNARDVTREELSSAVARVRGIADQQDPEPPLLHPRRAPRTGRAGAPLWAVCDFAEGLPAERRPQLEAALEDAGILGAWIAPDGTIHDADLTLLAPAGPGPTVPSLADMLVADTGDRAIDASVVRAVLQAIPLDGPLSVGPGRFRFGPLHGRADKPAAEFIGAAARAARRERLLAEAKAVARETEQRLLALDAELEQVRAAREQLAAERRSLPDPAALRSALRAERQTADRLAAREEQLAELLAQRERYDRDVAAARETLHAHVHAARLPNGAAELRAVAQAIERAMLELERAEQALAVLAAAERRIAEARQGLANSTEISHAAADDARGAHEDEQAAAGRLAAAQTADGASVSELRARAAALRAELKRLDDAGTAATASARTALVAAKDAERCAAEATDAVTSAEAERVAALGAVRAIGAQDLFSAALGTEAAPTDERESATWTLTTALERVRALPTLDTSVDLAARARRVSDAVSRLARKLVAFDMDAATYTSDDLTLVEITREGHRTSPTTMLEELDSDLGHREQVLSGRRREVLGKALLAEIAEHLRTRITTVRATVRARNEILRRCPTGAGRTVSLSWDADEDTGAPASVLALLGDRSIEHVSATQRDALFAFLEQRIADARAGAADEAFQTAIVDHLAVALDYRRWWRFTLHIHEPDGSVRKLTPRTQGLGSGGEQSVLMHLPLFATAAALYDLAPGAPRIVALDEAMDGIDPQTREQVFALLVDLDLDWVMTSYDLNPCVATVPRVGFYELHRENAEWGVWAQHFVWDGHTTTEVLDG
ncbi:MAG: TIGR02680 family protein [Solirubrobacteraceae bacterium]|nr:TIGR02680 family protein [Solirubrobacteraceae bacterium]